jgi:tetratricopeptide (TPR) repeat protein
MSDWDAHVEREVARYEDGEARLPSIEDADDRQRQLTRMGNAAGGAGLALLMDGRRDEAGTWFARAADRYRESFPEAPPGSWGRPIGAVKARLLAGDWDGARADAEWALDVDSRHAESPIGRYAASLALLVLGQDDEAVFQAASIQGRDDFPSDVANALVALASRDAEAYETAIRSVLLSFETREEYLEDIPVADTVIVLQALAARRGIAAGLSSPLLPA